MGVSTAKSCQQRSHQSSEGYEGVTAKSAEKEVEPHYIRLQTLDRGHEAEYACRVIERPATQHRKVPQFLMAPREFVGQNREIQEGIALQFLSNVESIFAQSSSAGRKRRYQTDLHSPPISRPLEDSMCFQVKLL